MAENATSIPPGGMWKIKASDFLKGLWLSVGSAVLSLVYLLISNHWKLPSFDQIEPYLNAIAIGFVSYIGKNVTTNNVGQLFKPDKSVVMVGKDHLQAISDKAAELDSQ